MMRMLMMFAFVLLYPQAARADEKPAATMHRVPFCGCCEGHADHLRAHGYRVTVVETKNMTAIRKKYGVPQELEGCHAIEVGGYVVEGHVRRAGAHLRIGVTLVDTRSGSNLWTETYDRDFSAGVFQVQDDVTAATVATIGDQTGLLARAMAAAIAEKPLAELTVAELVVRYHLYTENFNPIEHAALRRPAE